MRQRQNGMRQASHTLHSMASHIRGLEAELQDSVLASKQQADEALAAKDTQIQQLERWTQHPDFTT